MVYILKEDAIIILDGSIFYYFIAVYIMAWSPIGIDGVFFLSLVTILAGSFGVAIKYCLKSKCEHLNLCCGLLVVDRRVDLEVQEEIKEIEMGIKEDEKSEMPEIDVSKMRNNKKN